MEVAIVKWTVGLALVIASVISSGGAVTTSVLDACKHKVEPIGCYEDSLGNRAMPEQIINERDEYSNVYNGIKIDWKNYHTYLQGFICRCAEKALAKGYKVIGIQFYGECWSGPDAHNGYKKHDKSKQCINGEYKFCESKWPVCSGKDSTNYVYKIAPTECDVAYEPVGCFKDSTVEPRPLPDYVMNERDYTTPNWNKKLIDWKNWDTYSPQFICRCAKAIKEKGYTVFGAQFYGECWSGADDKLNVERDGSSDRCIAEGFNPCPYNSFNCVGMDHVNRVYRLMDSSSKEPEVRNATVVSPVKDSNIG